MSGAGFVRRYTFDPGLAEILKIEGVVIIDREPPSIITGLGFGAACLVAEFEDGDFNTPIELFSGVDQLATLGGFGFTHDGLPSSNPCARARYVDSTLTPEYWNGNGFIALAGKTFNRLFVVRPDTSVGSVSFTRRPFLLGTDDFSWNFATGQTVVLQKAYNDTDTATFTAAVATLTSAAGSYPTGFTGGESINVTIDEGTDQQIGPIDIVFDDADESQAQVIARINATLGYTAASDAGGSATALVGRVGGTSGAVQVNSVSAVGVTTKTGFSAALAQGTGNVSNIDAVTLPEVKAVVEAAVNGVVVDRDANGNLRITATGGTELFYKASSTADNLGLVEDQGSESTDGHAFYYSGAGTYPTTFAGGETFTIGFDGEQDVTIVFDDADETQAQVVARINGYFTRTVAAVSGSDITKLIGAANGGEVRVVTGSSGVLTKLGLTAGTYTAAGQADTVIPAGTRVSTTSTATTRWLTMQSTAVASDDDGPYSIKVRPCLDDGTAGSASAAAVVALIDPVPLAAFTISNPLGLSAALSEAAIDAAYATAIDATLSQSAVTRDANVIVSARQSNAVRAKVRSNVASASAVLRGRSGCIRPPLGTTTRARAKSTSAQPGVGAYRSDRVFYCFPGANQFIPQIAARGTGGGAGFTADGYVDVGADVFAASAMSMLPPEANIGQETDFLLNVAGIEVGNPDVQALEEADYVSLKAAGIVALRIADKPIFQSDVTSVDPALHPSQVPGERRRMADYIEDSLATRANAYAKKSMSRQQRANVYGEFQGFLTLLQSPGNEDSSRITGYRLDAKSGNPQAALDSGAYRIITRVKMNPTMLDIIIDATIGATVSLEQTQ